MEKYCIVGTDDRSNYIRKLYINENINIVDFEEADYIISSVPFTRDLIHLTSTNIKCDEFIEKIKGKTLFTGAVKEEIKPKLKDVTYYDLMRIDEVATLNAIPTAEGAICEAIKNSNTVLSGKNVLVMGYGKVGKVLSQKLNGIGCNVYCEARKESDLAMIEAMGYNSIHLNTLDNYLNDMDYIFNTIPLMMLNEERLRLLKEDVLIIDLASNPGGVNFDIANKLNRKVVWSLSLPSKVAPKSAAIYLKSTIDRIIKEIE